MMVRVGLLAVGLAFGHGALHEQIEAVSKAITLAPSNAALYVKRGELRRMHQEWASAAADFDRALGLDRQAAEAILGQARLAMDRGMLPQADLLASEYLQQRPTSEVGFALRADVRARRGSWRGAAEDYAAAIRLAREPGVEYFLGAAEALGRSGQDAAALEAIAEGAKRLGGIVTLEQWAVDFLVSRKRWDEALARQQGLVDAAPRKESALFRRAEIQVAAGRPRPAKASLAAALAAWERLPDRIQRTAAMQELRARMRTVLGGI